MTSKRKLFAATLAAASVAALVLLGTAPAGAAPALPTSIAALGDSISQATDSAGYGNFPANSWSTGSSSQVDSQAARLAKALGPKQKLAVYNDSVSGATASALPGQAATAVAQGAQYVTIEIGANDACAKSATSTAAYTSSIAAAVTTLQNSTAVKWVQVVSVPNLQQLYTLEHGKLVATIAWLVACPGLLVAPAAVQSHVTAYNAVLQSVCAANSKCVFVPGVAAYSFTAAQISPYDDFHPSVAGQKQLAALTSAATPWGALAP